MVTGPCPCENCITLVICKGIYKKQDSMISLLRKCEPLEKYLFTHKDWYDYIDRRATFFNLIRGSKDGSVSMSL